MESLLLDNYEYQTFLRQKEYIEQKFGVKTCLPDLDVPSDLSISSIGVYVVNLLGNETAVKKAVIYVKEIMAPEDNEDFYFPPSLSCIFKNNVWLGILSRTFDVNIKLDLLGKKLSISGKKLNVNVAISEMTVFRIESDIASKKRQNNVELPDDLDLPDDVKSCFLNIRHLPVVSLNRIVSWLTKAFKTRVTNDVNESVVILNDSVEINPAEQSVIILDTPVTQIPVIVISDDENYEHNKYRKKKGKKRNKKKVLQQNTVNGTITGVEPIATDDAQKNAAKITQGKRNRSPCNRTIERKKLVCLDRSRELQPTKIPTSQFQEKSRVVLDADGILIVSTANTNAQASSTDSLSQDVILLEPDEEGDKRIVKVATPNRDLLFANRPLRPVVIDGSNVAFEHGKVQNIFSCKGIEISINYFLNRGHKHVVAFVPQYRRRIGNPRVQGQDILERLALAQLVVFTPSRNVNGRSFSSYDDRFIIKLATENGGVILSNDNYRDLMQENEKWKKTIEERLLMYCFVEDMLMIPDDPLGRNGPCIEEFLSFPESESPPSAS